MSLAYRREVDGLRALAILPVLLFHAQFAAFSGGFVGVDVFFVISGYLITSIILSEQQRGEFSIWRFYERRARRILPALFVIMVPCLILGWAWLAPDALDVLGGSIAATILFCSNVFFWRQSGYFAPELDVQPLLHTWSLAVEEQYYVLFPIFVWLVLRFGRRFLLPALFVVAIASFAICEWGSWAYPTATYYLTPTRAWELLVGAMIAVAELDRPLRAPRVLQAPLGLLGLALVFAPVLFYNENTRFPGVAALAPVFGTALLLVCARPDTVIGRVLGHRVLVGIGLISYTLYLWHQPILAFARVYQGRALTDLESLLAIAVSFPLAMATTHFVERPFRNKTITPARTLVFSCAGAAAVLFASGAALALSHGAPQRLSPALQLTALDAQRSISSGDCVRAERVDQPRECLLGDQTVTPTIALWGDSFADALTTSFSQTLAAQDLSAVRFIYHACPSITGVTRNEPQAFGGVFGAQCRAYGETVFRALLSSQQIRVVVLDNAYNHYLQLLSAEPQPVLVAGINPNVVMSEAERRDAIFQRIRAQAEALARAGKTVIIVGAQMTDERADPRLAISRAMTHGAPPIATPEPRARFDAQVAAFNARLRSIAHGDIVFVDPNDIFCERNGCSFVQQSRYLLADGAHLSGAGSARLATAIMSHLRD